ncbi:MAG: glycosyl hydrolase 115 family protein [Prevotella sp.]|nr:glycosyl hydrolase 115 family protein [Prevotella sp.]
MKRLTTHFAALCLVFVASVSGAMAADPFVGFAEGDWLLNDGGRVKIYVSDGEQRGVALAVDNLCQDLKRVCGAEAVRTNDPKEASVVVGTIGVLSDYSDRLKGKHEMYIIDARQGQIFIAGSDRRGAIYGVYELSRQIGVSPWYDWADVPIEHHDHIYIKNGSYTDGEPAVRWRGLFLNDEAPCLSSWVKNTFGTNYGDHRFYARVFELILRLKGNMLWPAMWMWAFYADDPLNSKTADEMGIIIGTSHHEPMARNHQEYARHRSEWGPWNYQTNQKQLDRFFREGIERMKGTDDIVTIGMRGDGDEAMSAEADTKLLERIVGNQRAIIKKVTGRPAKETPQVWALYKEVQDYYDMGMRVPDDVTILLCDDNWGNIRRVPNAQERRHKGGWGLYYHVDYVGAPRNTKWLNVTQTQQMFEQLSLAYDFGIDRMWILNVGDLKPMEYPIQLFMDMAWNPKEFGQQNIVDHTRRFFGQVLDEPLANEAADIFNTNCKYAARVTAEMLDAKTYNVATGEWRRVADDYQRLEARALRLYLEIPEACRDFYRELLLFPVQAMANVYDMYYAQAMNSYLAERGNPDANRWAERVGECFLRDSLLCLAYNKEIAGGKWDGMMTQKHIGYTSWNDNFPHDMLPATKRVETAAAGGFTFRHSDGYVAMEAEHYYAAQAGGNTAWTTYPDYGRTRSAVALTPYSEPTGDASLCYRFTLPVHHPSSVKVLVVVKSTLDFENRGGHEFTVSLDDCEPAVVNFNRNLVDREPYLYSLFYPTIARRVVENTVELPVADGTQHELRLHPRHPGIVFEKVVVDFGGYQPQYLYGEESEVVR